MYFLQKKRYHAGMNYFKIKMTAEGIDQEAIRAWFKQAGAESIQISDGLFVVSDQSEDKLKKKLAESQFSNVALNSLTPEELKNATPEMQRLMKI